MEMPETSYRIDYRVDIEEGWRMAEEENNMPAAKKTAGMWAERGYMIRITKVTTEEQVVWTNADNFPAALRAAFGDQPDRVLGAGGSPSQPTAAEVVEENG